MSSIKDTPKLYFCGGQIIGLQKKIFITKRKFNFKFGNFKKLTHNYNFCNITCTQTSNCCNCWSKRENLYISLIVFKGYIRYKTITSQNVLSEAQVKNFSFCRKVMFRSNENHVFVFLIIPWFTKSVTSWWVLYMRQGAFLSISFEP